MRYPLSNKKFTVCLTHDVDRVKKTYQYITHFAKTRDFHHIKSFFSKENPYWNFNKIMEAEKRLGVRSTFFFLNETERFNPFTHPKKWSRSKVGRYKIKNPKISEIIRKLDKNGWEIGVHGSYSSYKNLNLLKKEKKDLEKIVGHEIIGIRQHYLNLNENTWRLQEKAGFKYDSSFGFNDGNVGFMEKKYHPFRPIKDKKDFLVIPIAIMDWCLLRKNNSVKDLCIDIIRTAEKHGGVLTLNWHQENLNEEESPDYLKIYKNIIKECKKRKAYIGTCKDIYNLNDVYE